MDALKSKLAEKLFNSESKKVLLEKLKKGDSIIGTTVTISGEEYVVSDGSVDRFWNDNELIEDET